MRTNVAWLSLLVSLIDLVFFLWIVAGVNCPTQVLCNLPSISDQQRSLALPFPFVIKVLHTLQPNSIYKKYWDSAPSEQGQSPHDRVVIDIVTVTLVLEKKPFKAYVKIEDASTNSLLESVDIDGDETEASALFDLITRHTCTMGIILVATPSVDTKSRDEDMGIDVHGKNMGWKGPFLCVMLSDEQIEQDTQWWDVGGSNMKHRCFKKLISWLRKDVSKGK